MPPYFRKKVIIFHDLGIWIFICIISLSNKLLKCFSFQTLARDRVGFIFDFKLSFGPWGNETSGVWGHLRHTVWASHHWPISLDHWAFEPFSALPLACFQVSSDSWRVGLGVYRSPAQIQITDLSHRCSYILREGWLLLPALSFCSHFPTRPVFPRAWRPWMQLLSPLTDAMPLLEAHSVALTPVLSLFLGSLKSHLLLIYFPRVSYFIFSPLTPVHSSFFLR